MSSKGVLLTGCREDTDDGATEENEDHFLIKHLEWNTMARDWRILVKEWSLLDNAFESN